MKTYIIWNASEYRTLEEALVNGAGKVIRSAIEAETMQSLLDDITDYCCHTVFTASEVKGSVASQLTPENNAKAAEQQPIPALPCSQREGDTL